MPLTQLRPPIDSPDLAPGQVRPTRAIVSLEALRNNLRRLRGHLPVATRVMGVVKADAYGHGLVEVGRALVDEGVDALAVALVEEARALREARVRAPILLLSPGYRDEPMELVTLGLQPVVSDLEELPCLDEAGRAGDRMVEIHLKADTGMGRLGLDDKGFAAALESLPRYPHLRLVGCMSHLASAEDDPDFTRQQVERFERFKRQVEAAGFVGVLFHLSNTAGLIRHRSAWYSGVRPGIGLYGYGTGAGNKLGLEPVLTLESRIVRMRELPVGATVGYGRSFRCRRPTRMAVLPIGYGDGLPRALSNRGEVLVEGYRCPIVGMVNMDLTCVDVTDVAAAGVGSRAVLIGSQGGEVISAQEVADRLDTIPYELLCALGGRVPRVYVE